MEQYYRLIQRRDTAANWTSANPILEAGEWAYETDTKKIKMGDGTTAWNSLPYFQGGSGGTEYTSGNGVTVNNTNHTISADTTVMATIAYVDEKLGEINNVLDTI